MLHANLMALRFIQPELWPVEVLHCTNKDFRPFVLLWPCPWPDDLHIWTWPISLEIPDVQKWTSYVKTCDSYRNTACECVHFRSRDKDDGHTTIRHSRNSMLHANLKVLWFIESDLWPIDALHAEIGIFDFFAPVTLTLTQWLSTNLIRIARRYSGFANMNFLRQGFRKLSSYRQTKW